MTRPPTLADMLLRQTFTKPYQRVDPRGRVRDALLRARRFVLDEGMSEMMSDLAYAALDGGAVYSAEDAPKHHHWLDQIRRAARSPHPCVWVEWDMKARSRRTAIAHGNPGVDPEQVPERVGMLIEQHPTIPTAFRAVPGASQSVFENQFLDEPNLACFGETWRTDDETVPAWSPVIADGPGEQNAARLLTGIQGYSNRGVALVQGYYEPWVVQRYLQTVGVDHLLQYASDLRYMWAFLATLNDVPVVRAQVRASKGFVARGRYRRFLDHETITLTVPSSERRAVAERAVAVLRRRAHQVRGHWRTYERNKHLEGHDWVPVLGNDDQYVCACGSLRTWVHEHQRGDASLGFVTHDYSVRSKQGT